MTKPRLAFFCELETDALQELFADPTVLDALRTLDAEVSLGLIDLSPGRAGVVRKLNHAGVPVVAWQLLPKSAGYWFNVDNAPEAVARYSDFRAWTREEGLRWAGVGLDIEPDFEEMARLTEGQWWLAFKILRRAFDAPRLRRAQALYRSLVAWVRSDGYRVESYQMPIIVDERKAGSTLVRKAIGLVDLDVDREVLMLYSSLARPWGPAALWSYGEAAQGPGGAIGVGSTGGGVDDLPKLTWEDLARDLRLATHWTEDVAVFSLEGCVEQGFLQPLLAFDWDRPVRVPIEEVRQVNRKRRLFRAFLRLSARPLAMASLGAGLLLGLLWLASRVRKLGRRS
jgi:hypothetical protein